MTSAVWVEWVGRMESWAPSRLDLGPLRTEFTETLGPGAGQGGPGGWQG